MDILDCEWKFKFQCPKLWENLRVTGDDSIRLCDQCERNVYLCRSHEDVSRNGAQGNCVAIGFSEHDAWLGFELIGEINDDFPDAPDDSERPRTRTAIAAIMVLMAFVAIARWVFFR